MTPSPQLDNPGLGALLGPRLRERRNKLGKTLSTIAYEADVSTGYLSSIETGASVPSLPVLARITHALEVSLAELLRNSSSARLSRGHITDSRTTGELAASTSELQIVRRTPQQVSLAKRQWHSEMETSSSTCMRAGLL